MAVALPLAIFAAAPALAATRVVATTTDPAALVAAVGGDLVSVESIVPAVDPEAYEPRPGDIAKVRQPVRAAQKKNPRKRGPSKAP